MPDIFLSYSRDDSLAMEVIVSNLRKLGFNVWVDIEHLKPGTPQWSRAVKKAVRTVDGLVVLCSPSAERSEWVNREVYMAKTDKKPVLPVLVQGTELDAIPADIVGAHYCDMRGRADRHKGFREVAEWLVMTFEFDVPDFEFDPSVSEALPSIQVINISGHVEGHVVGITGDVQGDLNVAGGDVVKEQGSSQPAPTASLDELNRAVLAVLPEPFEWCEIPAGQVTLKGDAGTFDVEPFYLAKYPITYEQFQVFLDADDGFTNDRWWQGLAATAKHRQQPGQQRFTHAANLPRENVSWYDAIAFCHWLSARIGQTISLPTEWQWQWAAQGPGGLAYPYGNEYDSAKCNTRESGIGMTTPVTQYPAGASPFGVLDMSGNVWEWCLNEYEKPTNIEVARRARRVLRGGSWLDDQFDARTSFRGDDAPHYRDYFSGFRVVCGRPPSQ